MSSPTPKVEIAFTNDPLTLAPTWVDVSVYLRRSPGVTIRRGRQSELDQFDAGSCTLTLSNRDRRFDPSYAAGPYFGNLIPRKRIRVTAVWATVDYPMFTGWVTGWPQGFAAPAGKDATVTIEAVDSLAWLANNNLPADLVYDYANTTIGNLELFLRNADSGGWYDATNSGYFGIGLTGTNSTGGTIAAGSTSTAVRFDGATEWGINPYQSAGPWSISWWMQVSRLATAGVAMGILGGGNNSTFNSKAIVDVAGKLTFYVETAGDVGMNVASTGVILDDNIPHHIVVCHDNSATAANMRIYVDGVNRTGVSGGTTSEPLTFDVIGNVERGSPTSAYWLFNGSIQDVAVFSKQLSAAEVSAFYQRSYGYLGESSTARVTRLLDDVGWPATWRDLTTTSRATVGELVYNGAPVLGKLQEVQRTEQGRIFAAKDGDLAFLSRYYVQEATAGSTVQQIFSDDGGATALPFSTFGFQFNDLDVTNAATVTTPTTWAKSSDAASITANGLQSKKVDTILTTFTQADTMAAGLVAKGKTATYRAAPILVYPENNTTRWDEVLLLELAYRVSMEITPMTVGSQNVQEVTIEQIEWSIENTLWSFTVTGSPCFGGTAGEGWFVIGSSLIGGPDVIGY